MKNKIIILFALLVLLSSLSFAQVEKPKEVRKAEELSLSKIVEMSKAGLGEETIINAIINSNQSFVLTVKEILYLKEAGVSEEIINFMLRSRPVETAPVAQEVEAQEPGEPKEPLPEYVADAAEGNYYDGYEYTDGYNFQDDRGSTIAYHYYGPWFRAYPYYYGFYYYPMSHYYYHYYPDDYYYYFYYPHFSSWRWYYNYPHYYRSHYYYGSGGRFVRSPGADTAVAMAVTSATQLSEER